MGFLACLCLPQEQCKPFVEQLCLMQNGQCAGDSQHIPCHSRAGVRWWTNREAHAEGRTGVPQVQGQEEFMAQGLCLLGLSVVHGMPNILTAPAMTDQDASRCSHTAALRNCTTGSPLACVPRLL